LPAGHDGRRFITLAGATVLVYSAAGVQEGSIASVPAGAMVVGQGNWVWTHPDPGATLSIYPATVSNPPASATFDIGSSGQPTASGLTIGVATLASSSWSVIDLSGSTPLKTDYTAPVSLSANGAGAYAAVSAGQWIAGNQLGVLLDGASINTTPRYFGYGQALSFAGGRGYFAIATASANVLYFDSATLSLEGKIPFATSKVAISADGTLLVALGDGAISQNYPINIYSLPAGALQYAWPYSVTASGGTAATDIALSSSGTVLVKICISRPRATCPLYYQQQAGLLTGGSSVFSTTFSSRSALSPPPAIRISPDGTLIATAQSGVPLDPTATAIPGTNLMQNGTLVTAFSGLPAGWLDNSRLLVNNYVMTTSIPADVSYSGCSLYGPDGSVTGGACALTQEVGQFQSVTSDTIYVPAANAIFSVSTGAARWMSADPGASFRSPVATFGAVAAQHVVFMSGHYVLAQSFTE
jgi:hypothetical protein